MNRNAVNNPKVRYELGEGGAPEEDLGRMELLVEEYTFRSDQSTKNQKQQHETINMNESYNQAKTNIRHHHHQIRH